MFIAKLFAYEFDNKALHFIYGYLRHRKQRTKMADSYSSWQEILYGVSQGSILGPLLFNANLCDLFITASNYDIANYADDNAPYVSGKNIEEVVASLEDVSEFIFQWFRDNQFQGHASKCHVLLSTDKQVHVNIGTAQIENTQNEKLLGITINSKLSFDRHIQQIGSRASAKLKTLARIARFMNITKRKILLNAFFNAQFSYCPLTWMFHSRKLKKQN